MAAKKLPKWREILNFAGLLFTFIGGVALAYAFEIEPTHFKLVEDPSYKPPDSGKGFAICHDNEKVVAGYGGPLVPAGPCPALELKSTGATPQLVANRPNFATWGVRLLIFGFLLQVPLAWAALKAAAR